MTKFKLFCSFLVITCLTSAPGFAYEDELDSAEFDDYVEQNFLVDDVPDPFEIFNRMIFGFNYSLDQLMFKPIANSYRLLVPEHQRKLFRNIVHNTFEPINIINSLLQLDFKNAGESFWRFILNTTFGLGGIFDFAEKYADLSYRYEDFGQTLGVWGVGEGFYIMLPILGPSTLRDTAGKVFDYYADPVSHLVDDDDIMMVRYSLYAIDSRERLIDITNDLEKNSLDLYTSVKSMYVQNRKNSIANGKRKY